MSSFRDDNSISGTATNEVLDNESIETESERTDGGDVTADTEDSAVEPINEDPEIKQSDAPGLNDTENQLLVPVTGRELLEDKEIEADENLVEAAYEKVVTIVIDNMAKAMVEAGDYFFQTFFGGEIKRAQDKEPVKKLSFYRLIEKLHENHDTAPSKSWYYNAVNIAADKAYFQEIEFSKYEDLGVTQRVYLARVKGFDKKKELIEEILEKGYSVRELKDRIDEIKPKRERLKLTDLNNDMAKAKLKEKDQDELEAIQKQIEKKMKGLNEQQKQIHLRQDLYRSSQDAVMDVLEEVKKRQKKKKA